jgi:transposase
MEACSGSHHWGRRLRAMGMEVKLLAPHFVSPYRLSGKTGKNDAADAAAICEAASRPTMRFVAVKSVEQQSMMALHRWREGYKEERTACINRIRGLLAEFGLVFAQRPEVLRAVLSEVVEDASNELGRGRTHGAAACTPALDRARVPHRLVRRTHRHARAQR